MKKLLLLVAGLFVSTVGLGGELIYPTTIQEFDKLTVMITGNGSGGTGVILKSTPAGSLVLTNRHVCQIAKESKSLSVTTSDKRVYQVSKYRTSKKHDLCIAHVAADLKYSAKVATERAKFGDSVTVSGHPYLYPTMVKSGHMSKDMTIQIVTEWVECSAEDYATTWICAWYGALPVLSTMESQTASFTIAGGNSGSSVFNSDGEITAVVYAGSGDGMSPAILVPHEYILQFIKTEYSTLRWQKVANSKVFGRATNKSRSKTQARAVTDIEQLLSIKDLAFPALKSDRVEKFIKLYQCLKGGNKVCFSR